MKKIFYILILLVVGFSCKPDKPDNENTENYTPTPYHFKVPQGFPPPILPAYNPMTVEGVQLGKMLFYDRTLGSNGRSCNSCHLQEKAFMIENEAHLLDPAIFQNIPSLTNLAFKFPYNWNGAFDQLDLVPIVDFGPLFLDINKDSLINRLNRHPLYPKLFKTVYHGKDVINKDDIEISVSYAIAQFLRTIVSSDSKFDRYLQGKTALNAQEQRGMLMFYTEKGDCFHCHSSILLTDNQFHNIGLDETFEGQNRGRFEISHKPEDLGKFKTPSLKNVMLTAPYMHDGRFKTIEEAIQHYNTGVKSSATLDPIMTKTGKETGLNLTAQDIADLKAFLNTFTDSTLLVDPNLKSPF